MPAWDIACEGAGTLVGAKKLLTWNLWQELAVALYRKLLTDSALNASFAPYWASLPLQVRAGNCAN
jgi:hypothetical protein